MTVDDSGHEAVPGPSETCKDPPVMAIDDSGYSPSDDLFSDVD